jgi:Rrf2 family protein
MIKITSQEEFGLRFLLHLAKNENQEISLSDIAAKEGVSMPYVRKIFGILRLGGLVKASKGVQGGYSLIRSASQINLKEVFNALKTHEQDFSCSYFTGNLDICANHSDCGVRPLISLMNRKIDDFLLGINLSQLVKEEKQVAAQLQLEPTSQILQKNTEINNAVEDVLSKRAFPDNLQKV